MSKQQGGHNLKWETRETVRYIREGWSDSAIARTMGCTSSAVIGIRSRLKAGQYKSLMTVPAPISTLPPSQAMIRLAEFDPIIRRALAQRNGEEL